MGTLVVVFMVILVELSIHIVGGLTIHTIPHMPMVFTIHIPLEDFINTIDIIYTTATIIEIPIV